MVYRMKKIFTITITIILLSIPCISTYNSQANELEISDEKHTSSGQWIQEVGNHQGQIPGGFGLESGLATRGIGIYNDELYVGTQNLALIDFSPLLLKITLTILVSAYKLVNTISTNFFLRILNKSSELVFE